MEFFKIEIKQIKDSSIDLLEILADEANSEGYRFVQRTMDEWKNGINNFSKKGERLFGIFVSDLCIGVGGLNVDPYIDDPNTGRIRHVFISLKYRRKGFATLLLRRIIDTTSNHFELLRLYTENPNASSFYESLGFIESEAKKETHILKDLENYQ